MARAAKFVPYYPADWNTAPFTVAASSNDAPVWEAERAEYDAALLLALDWCQRISAPWQRVRVINANGYVVRDFGPALR